MLSDELKYITLCKDLIEKKLVWQESHSWKQRDYLNLIELLENKSGITLSLSTIKRIWAPDYTGTPHPSTLDAFAQFLDYKSWLDFKEKNYHNLSDTDKNRLKNIYSVKRLLNNPFITLFLIILFLGIVVLGYQFLIVEKIPDKLDFSPENIEFYCDNSVAEGVPNTIIFNYDVSSINADSFFIQQKWNTNTRFGIDKNKHQYTSVYYIPGYHKAKLIANDSIIKEIDVRINTNEWLALIRKSYADNSPVFIRKNELKHDGVLHANNQLLSLNKVDVDNQTLISYFYVAEFDRKISSGDFSFETRLKCDSIFNFTCPHALIGIIGEGDRYFIPVVTKGCIGDASLKLGDVMIDGKTNDLSAFGVNVFQWQKVKLKVKDKKAQVFINDSNVYTVTFNKDIGKIAGFSLNFLGTGIVDYVKLFDKEGEVVYSDDFE